MILTGMSSNDWIDRIINNNALIGWRFLEKGGQTQIRSIECPGINWKRGRLKKSGI